MAEHTPTPWRLCTTGNLGSAIEAPSGKSYYDGDDGYRIVASYQECTASPLYATQEANRLANGAFIVKAVNNHEALVKALKLARQRISYLGAACTDHKHFEANERTFLPAIDEVLNAVVGPAGDRS